MWSEEREGEKRGEVRGEDRREEDEGEGFRISLSCVLSHSEQLVQSRQPPAVLKQSRYYREWDAKRGHTCANTRVRAGLRSSLGTPTHTCRHVTY